MANRFGSDILIQAQDPSKAALFYVEHLGFEITDDNPKMIGLHGKHINLFIEPGPTLGPVLEVTVDSVEKAKARLVKNGCEIVKDQPDFPRCYAKDPHRFIYNPTPQPPRKAPALPTEPEGCHTTSARPMVGEIAIAHPSATWVLRDWPDYDRRA